MTSRAERRAAARVAKDQSGQQAIQTENDGDEGVVDYTELDQGQPVVTDNKSLADDAEFLGGEDTAKDTGPPEGTAGEQIEQTAEAVEKAAESTARDVAATVKKGEAIPRMGDDRLQMRIRIAPKWLQQCPKRPGTIAYDNWQMYVDGMTVSAYLDTHERRRARTDLRWDLDHNFIYLQSPQDYETEQAALRDGENIEDEETGWETVDTESDETEAVADVKTEADDEQPTAG